MRTPLAITLILSAAFAAVAADPPAPKAPTPKEKLPVAVVNLQRVLVDSAAGKAALDELEAYAKEKQAAITAKQEEAIKLRRALKEKAKTLKPEEKDELEKKAAAAEAEAQKVLKEAQRHIDRLQRNAFDQLQKEVSRVIEEYAKERGIQLIFDTSGPNAGKIVFARPGTDITDDILQRLTEFKIQPLAEEKPDPADKDAKPQVVLETTVGDIVLELDRAKAPITVANFLKYVDAKHYDGTIFHRVIEDFMIQGGGWTEKLEEKPTRAPILNEADNGLKNVRGTIAMARTADPDSATAQFFINVVDNPKLDESEDRPGYTVFGKVLKGMDVVDQISKVKTGKREVKTKGGKVVMEDVPTEPVIIKSARRVKLPEKPQAPEKPEPPTK